MPQAACSLWHLLAACALLARALPHAAGAEPRRYLPPVRPDEEKLRSCGDARWRAWYAELAWRMREGRLPQRYLVNGHFHTGLSDRLVSRLCAAF
jgi:hypothetical protein